MLQLQRIGFAHSDAVPLFEGVTLELARGFTALVGPNGVGKTTLLRLLAGELRPHTGTVRRDPGTTVRLCAQRVDSPTPDVAELATMGTRLARRLRADLGLVEGDLDRWGTLSPGERRRWQIGAALATEPDVLLLDEPTNHLDLGSRTLLLGVLRRHRGTGVVVSHDRRFLGALCSSTARLVEGRLEWLPLGIDASLEQWQLDRRRAVTDAMSVRRAAARLEQRAQQEQQLLSRRQAESSIRRRMKGPRDHDAREAGRKGRAASAAAKQSRAIAVTQRRLDAVRSEAAHVRIERDRGRSLFVDWEPPRRARLVDLVLPELRAGDKPLLQRLSLCVDSTTRIALTGPNGAGKSTLLGALREAASVPRDRLLVLPQELTAEEGRRYLQEARELPRQDRGRLMQLVAALGSAPDRLLGSDLPSPGEARKLLIALGLARSAWLLLLDEPTNHLDLPAIERLETALEAYPGALVIASHDESFLERCTTTRWALRAGMVQIEPLGQSQVGHLDRA